MIVDELVSVLGLEIRDTGLTQFRSNIQSTIGKLGLLGAGAIAAASAITALVVNSASETSANAKFARAVNLSAQELQRFEFAAKRMGLAGGALRGFLSDVTTQLAQFRTGGADKLFEAFAQIGVNPLENGKPKEALELLLQLADAASNASTEVQALGVAGQIGLGAEWFPFLKLGREGIMGIAGEADVLSDSAIRAAENFDRSMQRFKNVGSTLIAQEGAPILDAATAGIEALVEYSKSQGFADLKQDIRDVADSLFRALQNLIALHAELTKDLPKGSTLAALAAGLAVAFPVPAAVAGTGYVASNLYQDRNVPAPGEVVALQQMLSSFADKVGNVLDYLPGTGFQPPASDFLPRGSLPGDRAAQQMTARTIVENLTINVATPRDAAAVVDTLDRNETIRDAAERGTGAAR
jgi:hypothetical protein